MTFKWDIKNKFTGLGKGGGVVSGSVFIINRAKRKGEGALGCDTEWDMLWVSGNEGRCGLNFG